MTKPKIIGLIAAVATAATAISCWQTGRQETHSKIKVENDGGIINGFGQSSATTQPYDPCYIHVNDTPHIQLTDAELVSLSSEHDNSLNHLTNLNR
jgi:hypothetical protein